MPASSPHLASVVPSWLWGGGGAVAAEEEEGRWRRRWRGESGSGGAVAGSERSGRLGRGRG